MEVTIFGLKSRPELNGQTAAVKRYDNQKQRYAVEVQGETVSMRRDNLCTRCAVTVEAPSDGSEGAELPAAFSAAASTEASLCGYDASTRTPTPCRAAWLVTPCRSPSPAAACQMAPPGSYAGSLAALSITGRRLA